MIMPWLARLKRRAGDAMNSRLVVDVAETKLCAWLSLSTFVGQVAYAIVGWTWIDPVAGFVIAALRRDGRQGSLGGRTRLRRRTLTESGRPDDCDTPLSRHPPGHWVKAGSVL